MIRISLPFHLQTLARCENVSVKLGGLAMAFCNFPSFLCDPPASSEQLAQEWRPYVETCIEAIERGVEGVVILNGKTPHAVLLELFTEHGAGTLIVP